MKKAANRHRVGEKLVAARVWLMGSNKVKGIEVLLTERQWNSAYKRKSYMGYRVARVKRVRHESIIQAAISKIKAIRQQLSERGQLPVLSVEPIVPAVEGQPAGE